MSGKNRGIVMSGFRNGSSRVGVLAAAFFVSFVTFSAAPPTESTRHPKPTPVEAHGQLRVVGPDLVDAKGDVVQLKGMSLWDAPSYGEYCTPESLAFLRDDWDMSLFRAAMYTDYNGYFIGKSGTDALMKVTKTALDAGVYVLLDWHILTDGDPLKYKEQAKAFFAVAAEAFKDYPNIIYEICNEPNGHDVTWKGNIVPYAMEVIPVIRARDPDSVILVGTPTWSQEPHTAADAPLPFDNLMYVLHYYAGSHDWKEMARRIDYTRSKGKGVFVTEWGATSSDVRGAVRPVPSIAFTNMLAERKVSWANWSLSTKLEPTSMVKPGVSYTGPWTDGDLTESGLLVRSLVRGEPEGTIFADNFESRNFRGGAWTTSYAGMDYEVARSGKASAMLEGEASLGRALDASLYADMVLSFAYKTIDTEAGDRLTLEWFDGSTWKTLKELPPSADWAILEQRFPTEASGRADFAFRIASAFASDAFVWIDDVALTGSKASIRP